MVTYQLTGSILVITGSGAYRAEDWDAVFSEVSRDPTVPENRRC